MTKLNGVKNAIILAPCFLNGSKFNLSFYFHIVLYWEKVTSYQKFSHNLTFEVPILLHLWEKSFLVEIYRYRERHLHSKFLGVKKWSSANVFSKTKQKYVWWNICKVRKVYGCVAGASYFQFQMNWGSSNEWGFLNKIVL